MNAARLPRQLVHERLGHALQSRLAHGFGNALIPPKGGEKGKGLAVAGNADSHVPRETRETVSESRQSRPRNPLASLFVRVIAIGGLATGCSCGYLGQREIPVDRPVLMDIPGVFTEATPLVGVPPGPLSESQLAILWDATETRLQECNADKADIRALQAVQRAFITGGATGWQAVAKAMKERRK